MKLDATLSLSIILALVALIAPTITARINNRHAYKMKLLDIEQQRYEQNSTHVRQLFEQFLSDYGTFTGSYLRKDQVETQKSFYKCIPYVPSKYLDSFIYFYQLFTLTKTPLNKAEEYMQETLLNEIRDILKTL
ncbi:hypothetical protein [uncultured Vagococcus sp.]|uniref:hypothetical protein n=1 Tax=uncultured Vagococcus sp. TaxID=189676 RepID=UPI0025836EEA|nr:hypothetical protein [uncultured Vagococcus sp.]